MNQILSDGYTVKSACGCRLIFGSLPISDMALFIKAYSKKAVMDVQLANRIGASVVMGEPEDIAALRKMNLPISSKRQAEVNAALQMGLTDVADWLRDGERGSSSNAMCKRFFGIPEDAGNQHPCDPDDLRRCVLFLDATNSHDKIHQMADVSPQWEKLVASWDRLVAQIKKEMHSGSATETYTMMADCIRFDQ